MSALAELLARRIAQKGPISVADYMALALGHPEHGYYRHRDPFGAAGDFVTAPEVSQMFGELVGLWCAVVWRSLGAPDPVLFVELGPGRGSLMADALRAVGRVAPDFGRAARVHLVETSPALRQRQEEVLARAAGPRPPRWHRRFAAVPRGPLLVVANEFFDALPIRQYVRAVSGWQERRIDAEPGTKAFHIVAVPVRTPALPAALAEAPPGSVVEVSPSRRILARALAGRVVRDGGAALIIDYGHPWSAPGDTLQAVRQHAFQPVLERPGEADLTAHVDFEALAKAAGSAGAATHGPVPQGLFLARLGIRERAEALQAGASPAQARDVKAALGRLIDPRQMGTLFKALAITAPALPTPPGFAADASR